MTNAGSRRRLAWVVLLGIASLGAYADDVSLGDAAWASRAEGERGGRPQRGPALDAIRAYGAALDARPESLEARWKLLRALYFAGYFSLRDREERLVVFDRARAVADEGIERLAGTGERLEDVDPATLGPRLAAAGLSARDVARFYFWAGVNWGAWARNVGLLSAVRRGVANRLHDYTSVAVALEPDYEDGGPLRLLGRLHAELPRVPLVSGWVDRDRAIPLVQAAYDLAPEVPGNRLLLGLTLIDLRPERRDEALALLEEVSRLTPRPEQHIEDLAVREEARKKLLAVREQR